MNSIEQVASKLLELDNITIITHIRPDGDTLGSAYALKHALELAGRRAQVVCDSEISPRYRFLTGGEKDIAKSCTESVVCVDVAAPSMAGKYESSALAADIVIDHHATNYGFGKVNCIVPEAAACGEIMLEIIEKICKIDRVIAECLYVAVSTDTGCFVYANTTAATHSAAAALIDAGADIAKLNKKLFRTKTAAAFEIERRALDTLERFYNDTVVCMVVKKSWVSELSATEDDMESLSSVPSQIEGVKAAVTFRQLDENTYKLSVRTNGEIDGAAVCREFGGGGHKMAAGCTLCGDYDELKSKVASALYDNLKK